MLWKDLINVRPKRSDFVRVKRDIKLILTENITVTNVFFIMTLYFIAYFGPNLSTGKSYIDAIGKAMNNSGGYMLILMFAALIFINFQSAVYENKNKIYHDSVLNRISKGELIALLVACVVMLIASNVILFCTSCFSNANILFTSISMYTLASMIFIYSLLQVVFFYRKDKFSTYIALSIITLIVISALGILKENAIVACTAGTFAFTLNTIMNYRNT